MRSPVEGATSSLSLSSSKSFSAWRELDPQEIQLLEVDRLGYRRRARLLRQSESRPKRRVLSGLVGDLDLGRIESCVFDPCLSDQYEKVPVASLSKAVKRAF